MAAPGAPTGTSRIDRRFDLLRKQTEGQASAAQQQAQEGLDRKAASQGGLGSGAFLKAGMLQNKQLDAAKQNAIEGVESQRDMALGEQEERDTNRAFAREERLGSQEFQRGEGYLARNFQSQEAQRQRDFARGEAAVQRGFDKKLFDKEMKFKDMVHNDGWKLQVKGMKTANNQWKQQFAEDKRVSDFNMKMAQAQFDKKDIMESAQNMFGYDPRTGGTTNSGYGWAYNRGERDAGIAGGMFGG